MENGGIYKIINIVTGDYYIGSAINFKERKRRHFKDLKKDKHHSRYLQRSYNKHGKDNFKFEILEIISDKNLLIKKEQQYMDFLNPTYNMSKTAGSSLGVKHSKESNEKKRQYAIKNNIRPPESTWKDKQKQVLMLDKKTLDVLRVFKSLAEACRYINKDCTYVTTISSCCKNKRFSAFGYRWAYTIEDIKNLRIKKTDEPWNKGVKTNSSHRKKKVQQFDLSNKFVRTWESAKDAEEIFGKGISNCARGISKSSHGFIWKYTKS